MSEPRMGSGQKPSLTIFRDGIILLVEANQVHLLALTDSAEKDQIGGSR